MRADLAPKTGLHNETRVSGRFLNGISGSAVPNCSDPYNGSVGHQHRRSRAFGFRKLGFRVLGHQEAVTTCQVRKPQRRDLHARESLVGPRTCGLSHNPYWVQRSGSFWGGSGWEGSS